MGGSPRPFVFQSSLPPEPSLLQPLSIQPTGDNTVTVTADAAIADCQGVNAGAWEVEGNFGPEALLDIDIYQGVVRLYTESPAEDITHVTYDGTDPCLQSSGGIRLAAFSLNVPYVA